MASQREDASALRLASLQGVVWDTLSNWRNLPQDRQYKPTKPNDLGNGDSGRIVIDDPIVVQ